MKLSQEEFAERLNVTRQSVQKWESGNANPSLDVLINISKIFHVSVDALLFNSNARIDEEKAGNRKVFPDYEGLNDWEFYSDDLQTEYRQLEEEGADVSEYKELFESVFKLKRNRHKEKMGDILFEMSLNMPQRKDYPYQEPSDLEGIRTLRKKYDISGQIPEGNVLREKIAGAWNGRLAGCLSGKPVEGMRSYELQTFLKETGNYPMTRYMVHADVTEELIKKLNWGIDHAYAYADRVECAPVDDDTNYTVLCQKIVDEFGKNFTSQDVARSWVKYQPKDAYCTAERVAFKNIILGYNPPDTAIHQNPYREWIGAQIRADYFGYINPGNPERAAEMAWRDASISHTKNGIYGAMFVAAMIACAAVCKDIEEVIEGGLAQIPSTSRLYEAVRNILKQYRDGVSGKKVFSGIANRWDENDWHCWTHTISNAEIVVAALLFGEDDYSKSVGMAVQMGFDTDCNGATVGSIMGMKNGLSSIPQAWLKPLNGKLETSIFGVNTIEIDKLIEKTLEHINS